MKQCVDLTADDGYFAGLLAGAKAGDADLTDAVRSDLEKSVAAAADAYRASATGCDEILDRPEADACGRERYQLLARVPRGDGRPRGDLPLGRRSSPASPPRWRRSPSRSSPAPPSRRPSPRSTPTRHTSCTARTSSRRGCRPRQTRRSPSSPAPTSTSPTRCAPSSASSPDPDRWHLLHRRRGLLAPGPHVVVRAEGRHRVRHRRELTTVYHEGVPGHHLQVARRSSAPSCSTAGAACSPGPRGTARAGRSTPSGSWPTWATWTTRATGWACSTASRCAPPASCSTSASTAGSRRRRRSAGASGPTTRPAVPHRPRQHGRGLPALRARPLPRLAG